MSAIDHRLLLLHPSDNVFTLIRPLKAGDSLVVNGVSHVAERSLVIGHKIAACRIRTGEKIIKYGVPIGSAMSDIEPGQHVHTHNLQSDYLPTFTLDGSNVFVKNV